MPKFSLSVFLRLLVISLVVGTVLSVIGADPFEFWEEMWHSIVDAVHYIFGNGLEAIMTALRYTVVGAAVVVPIWLVATLFKRSQKDGEDQPKN